MKEVHLLIDDIRGKPEDFDFLARTYDEGLRILTEENITHLWLDHDLGEDRPSKNGYTLISTALNMGVYPMRVILVTSNPVGRQNIVRALESHGYARAGAWYVKEN